MIHAYIHMLSESYWRGTSILFINDSILFQNEILDEDKRLIAALDCYFLEENGARFKVSVPFKPYIYILVSKGTEQETTSYLLRKYQGYLSGCEQVMKEDLDLLNHLTGLKQQYIKCTFSNTTDLQKVRRDFQKWLDTVQDDPIPLIQRSVSFIHTAYPRSLGPERVDTYREEEQTRQRVGFKRRCGRCPKYSGHARA